MDVLLVGCGNMGFAMLSRWLEARPADKFHVVEPNEALRERAIHSGAQGVATASSLPPDIAPSLIILAVKPQVMGQVAPEYARFGSATFVSIAAGVTIATLEASLGAVPIVRTMPNTPAAVGQGMMVSVANDRVPPPMRGHVEALMGAAGRHAWLQDEHLMDAVTAISGSGPAYLFHFIECLSEAGAALGLPEDLAQTMALETVAGASALARSAPEDPSELRRNVTSPKGTTEAALNILMGRLGPLVEDAATAARDRGVELGKG